MEFKILGTLEVTDGPYSRTPSAPKVRQVLAVLLLRANHFVDVDALVYELWGESPPPSALTTIHTYVHNVRKGLLKASDPTARLVTDRPGYVLCVRDEDLDALTFMRLANEGGNLLERNRPIEATKTLRRALALWRGPVAFGVTAGRILQARGVHLEELKMQTIELWIRAETLQNRLWQIIPDLRSLVTSYPLNELLYGHLITALKQAGRRAEALDTYQRFRRLLDDEFGVEPSLDLRRLQRALLVEDGPEPGGWRPGQAGQRDGRAVGHALVAKGGNGVQ